MGLWGRGKRVLLEGLVVDAPPPWNRGTRRDKVTLVVRPPDGVPLSVEAKARITKDTWLLRGMTLPVEVDFEDPTDAKLDDDAIPLLKDRIAAGDPTILDPITAVRAARVAIEDAADAAMASTDLDLAGRTRDMRTKMRAVDEAERDERIAAAEQEYSTGPATAPDGRLRGYGRLVSRTFPRPDGNGETASSDWFTDAIYSVKLIGQEPYAVLKRYDRRDRREGRERYDLDGAGIVPVTVDPDDREDVEILWDEVPDHTLELLGSAMDQVDRVQRQIAPVVEGMYDQIFAAIPDPTMRAVLAQQVQAQGFELPAHLAGGGADQALADARLAKLAALRDSGVLTQAEYDEQVARMGT